MIDRTEAMIGNLRRRMSRSEWSVRRLGLSVSEETETVPGLVMIHIVGLARDEFERAMVRGPMSFCRRLVRTERYQIHAADARGAAKFAAHDELFFGLAHDEVVAGNEMHSGQSLLAGGSNYAGLCPAGAAEPHYCDAGGRGPHSQEFSQALLKPSIMAAHGGAFLRATGRLLWEGALVTKDVLVGPKKFGEFAAELADVPERAARNVFLREFSTAGATLDVARGLPIVHVNFLDYADVTARRGHQSLASQFALRGIDTAIRKIWWAARRSSRRDYDIWIYSQSGPEYLDASGFALLPLDAPIADHGREDLHPMDLRAGALHLLGRAPLAATARPFAKPRTDSLRIMTYNVHSCVGMDGKLSPERIARVIAQCDADVVALQELDVGRQRTKAIHQAQAIARCLKMEFHFHPAISLAEEQYGDAVLSRFPLRLVRAGGLPTLANRSDLEPRGALWVAVQFAGREIQLINTHLGLEGPERLLQVKELLGPSWLANPECHEPTILCGDFNTLPSSLVCRKLRERLSDAQLELAGHQPAPTFFTRMPVGRIDHVFVSNDLEVKAVEVPRTDLIRRASDHLPVIVELTLAPARHAQPEVVDELEAVE